MKAMRMVKSDSTLGGINCVSVWGGEEDCTVNTQTKPIKGLVMRKV
jgi:hypothetical protein